GVHGVGGIFGALAVGLFAFTPVEGGLTQLGKQALGVAVAIVFAGLGTFVIAKLVNAVYGLRVVEGQEREGLDLHVHGERGYHFDQV
ncbi:MAG: ammonium transporter, partial [Myxococcaceae bacterium]|nr:ammonium transporter [Myxococcaceae bacterium]